jgi:methionyl-tRNA formyltransferase
VNRQTARLDWSKDAATLARVIRAFDPEPGAWSLVEEQEVKFFGGRVVNGSGEPGRIIASGKTISIAAQVGAVEVSEIQPAGRKRMPAPDWLRGVGDAAGVRFS